MLTSSFIRSLHSKLTVKLRRKVQIQKINAMSGGSINSAAEIICNGANYFLKTNDAYNYPAMFEKEARGLNLLRSAHVISVPEVILTGEEQGISFLVLQFIKGTKRSPDFFRNFGSALAKMHRQTDIRFGLDEDNYIGSLHQSNRQHNNWFDFFVEERLEKQISLAVKNGKMSTEDHSYLNKLYSRLDKLFIPEQPSLLHGDLWSGNFVMNTEGKACIIDPAVYYGHREMDLAMSKLFGGFDDEFYEAYNSEFPLQPGFEERVDICNMYPLLVHVNLFGGNYPQQVRGIVKKLS